MPIAKLGRHNQTEGWAVDIETDKTRVSRRELLANNTVIWIICALAVLLVSVALISVSGDDGINKTAIQQVTPGDTAEGDYLDEAHFAFIERLVSMEKRRGFTIQAEFISDSELQIVVPADSSFDEIAYMSRFSAIAIKRRFGNRSWIYVYTRDSKRGGQLRKLATTSWSEREHNFKTKTEGIGVSE